MWGFESVGLNVFLVDNALFRAQTRAVGHRFLMTVSILVTTSLLIASSSGRGDMKLKKSTISSCRLEKKDIQWILVDRVEKLYKHTGAFSIVFMCNNPDNLTHSHLGCTSGSSRASRSMGCCQYLCWRTNCRAQ